jgi:hypothetical protein
VSAAAPAPAPILDDQNPWPGLAPFEETAERYFNGRAKESVELGRLVSSAPLTVLFGASGLGKTSLIKAGLFPLVRRGRILPIYIRLDVTDTTAPLIEQGRRALEREVAAQSADAPDFAPGESLWAYLHRSGLEIWSSRNQLLTPLFVFDQFEEVLTIGSENAGAVTQLRVDLADLIENRIPEPLANASRHEGLALDAQRYKVVLTFREDYLPGFESWKRDMPSIMRNRLWLRRMSEEQAFEAVHTTAPHLTTEAVARRIVRFFAPDDAPPGTQVDVEPVLLSLLCHGLNEERKAKGKAAIDEDLIAGVGKSILANHYRKAIAGLPDRVPAFIQQQLITEGGFRKPCDVADAAALYGVTESEIQTLVQRRLLVVEPRGPEPLGRTDSRRLTEVVKEDRERSRDRARARQRRRFIGAVAAALLMVVVALAWYANTKKAEAQAAEAGRVEADRSRKRAEEALRNLNAAENARQ